MQSFFLSHAMHRKQETRVKNTSHCTGQKKGGICFCMQRNTLSAKHEEVRNKGAKGRLRRKTICSSTLVPILH